MKTIDRHKVIEEREKMRKEILEAKKFEMSLENQKMKEEQKKHTQYIKKFGIKN
jgi:hypothetical protein